MQNQKKILPAFKNETKHHVDSPTAAERFSADWFKRTGYTLSDIPVGVTFVVRLHNGAGCFCQEVK